jgi:RNase P/RNase MRP subunit p29
VIGNAAEKLPIPEELLGLVVTKVAKKLNPARVGTGGMISVAVASPIPRERKPMFPKKAPVALNEVARSQSSVSGTTRLPGPDKGVPGKGLRVRPQT